MKCRRFIWRFGAALALVFPVAAGFAEQSLIEIRAVEGMRFDPLRRAIQPGSRVTIHFQNADATDQPHNIVIGRPGRLSTLVEAALALGVDGPAREYVPAGELVLAASRVLPAGERQEVIFDVPRDPAIYPYVCTFPGHGFLMFGAFYAGLPMPPANKDPNIPKSLVQPLAIKADPRPMVRRMFMPDSGPASIAVALSGRQNFCWDAGKCRLRYFWEGGFIDAEDYFISKGQSNARVLGKIWWRTGDRGPLRIGGAAPQGVKFVGYSIDQGVPEFEFTIDGHPVRERLQERQDGAVEWHFKITGVTEGIEFVAAETDGIALATPDGPLVNGAWKVPRDANGKFKIVVARTNPAVADDASQSKSSSR
jgi:azurin